MGSQRADLGPLETPARGSLRDAQFISCHKLFVAEFNVSKAEFLFVEMPARYRPFNRPSDILQIVGGVPQSYPSFHLNSTNHIAEFHGLKVWDSSAAVAYGNDCPGSGGPVPIDDLLECPIHHTDLEMHMLHQAGAEPVKIWI